MGGNKYGPLKAVGYTLIIFSISALIASVSNFTLDMIVISAYPSSDADLGARVKMIAYVLLIAGLLIGLFQMYCGLMAVMQNRETHHTTLGSALLLALIGYMALCIYQASTLIVMIITGLSTCCAVVYIVVAKKYSAYLRKKEEQED